MRRRAADLGESLLYPRRFEMRLCEWFLVRQRLGFKVHMDRELSPLVYTECQNTKIERGRTLKS